MLDPTRLVGKKTMIHLDSSEQYRKGRPDHLWWESPDGRRWYHEGRPDRLSWEWPDGRRGFFLRELDAVTVSLEGPA